MTARTFRAYSDAVNRNTGSSFPLGATVCPGGVNFSVFSKNATVVELLFFDRTNDSVPGCGDLLCPRLSEDIPAQTDTGDCPAGLLYRRKNNYEEDK
jgi:pullulanase/glycogen debranching enzyme